MVRRSEPVSTKLVSFAHLARCAAAIFLLAATLIVPFFSDAAHSVVIHRVGCGVLGLEHRAFLWSMRLVLVAAM